MRHAEMINLIFFSGLSILAFLQSLPAVLRIRSVLIGLSGIAVTMAAFLSASDVLRDWTPVPLMVMAYWQSGCFFQTPNLKLQKIFESWDARAFRALSWTRGLSAALELAYLICYPVVPLGVAALYAAGLRSRVDEYWLVVLLSAYPCYAMLPFIQLLPPRSLHPEAQSGVSNGALRRLNLWIVGRATHQATTFPSGHVAASTAIALVLLREAPPAGFVFLLIAVGIALGCVVGRYHYALDVIAAVIVAGIVFAAVTLQ